MPAHTLNELFFASVERAPRPASFLVPRGGSYHDVSPERFVRDVERASLGLTASGIAPGDRVAILSKNRYEWAVADFAILTAAAITVPIYPTLPARQIEHLLDNSGARAVFVSSEEEIRKILATESSAPKVELLIAFDASTIVEPRLLSLDDLYARGAESGSSIEHRRRAALSGPDDVATIIYTSGTTGIPKGVMLTHRNLLADIESCLQRMEIGPADVYLSFLPLSHILERMGGHFAILHAGATIAYAESPEKVGRNLLQVRPTMTIGVPRFFEKTHDRVQQAIRRAPPLRRGLFRWAERTGLERTRLALSGGRVPALLEARYRIAEALVFRRLRASFGGRVRFFVSGGAPLSREIIEFFAAVGLPIYEGYGLTETSPVVTMNFEGALRPGTAGRPIPGVEVRIAADGEILVRGPNVMKGYFHEEESTRSALQDGWLHTGDIGVLDGDGYLTITDRKKDILVTAGGKNIAPQPIENRLRACPYILEAVLFGDRKRFVAALLAPDLIALGRWASSEGIPERDPATLLQEPRVRALFRAEIERVNGDLAPFERIRRFEIIPGELTIEAGDLTPTLKIRRAAVAARFASLVRNLYADEG
jgi:long-chain acyl-CoA synthetase